jgi:hypothetical protein
MAWPVALYSLAQPAGLGHAATNRTASARMRIRVSGCFRSSCNCNFGVKLVVILFHVSLCPGHLSHTYELSHDTQRLCNSHPFVFSLPHHFSHLNMTSSSPVPLAISTFPSKSRRNCIFHCHRKSTGSSTTLIRQARNQVPKVTMMEVCRTI